MRVSAPFNHRIPKDIRANLRWRAAVHRRIAKDPAFAEAIREACAKDILFFINGFCWTYDPRRLPFSKLPLILYPFQEDAVLELTKAIGKYDLLVEKSRDMGASWICICVFFWFWLFRPMQSFLFVSRVENYVDEAGNPKSMFWKFDFLLKNLPAWLQPSGFDWSVHRRNMHIENPENLSVVDGESTNKNAGRGDRRTAILLDEFSAVREGNSVLSATRDATNCRIFNSTPDPNTGINNAFYDMRQTNIKKLRLHWSAHPLKSIGLYTKHGDTYEIIDKEYWATVNDPEKFMRELDAKILERGVPLPDGKLRSPWYARECERAGSAREIASELDIDYLGSGAQFFDANKVQYCIRNHARPPILVGDLEYDNETAEPIRFRENTEGNLRLWFLLDKDGKPPKDHKYSLGNDVSAGTGASNSCANAWDQVTCEKTLEYVNPHIRPEQFAKQSVAIARWLGNAYMLWESGGPGRQFGARVIEIKYANVYYRKQEEAISGKTSDIPGIAQSRDTKKVIIGNYRDALENGEAINRSKEALEETLEYIFGPDGSPVHSRSNGADSSGARDNHGDRAMADALAWKGIKERESRPKEQEPEIPAGCLAWRNKMREKEKQPSNRELDSSWR